MRKRIDSPIERILPSSGDRRDVRRFLWWPLILWDWNEKYEELRWLEMATFEQEWENRPPGRDDNLINNYAWVNKRWK